MRKGTLQIIWFLALWVAGLLTLGVVALMLKTALKLAGG